MLTKESFLQLFKRDEKAKEVKVGECVAFVRVISLGERTKFENSVNDGVKRDTSNFHAKFLVYALSDESGNRLFTDADIEAINSVGAKAMLDLFEEAWKFNGMGKAEAEELKKSSETEAD
jgi:hypothetical protein